MPKWQHSVDVLGLCTMSHQNVCRKVKWITAQNKIHQKSYNLSSWLFLFLMYCINFFTTDFCFWFMLWMREIQTCRSANKIIYAVNHVVLRWYVSHTCAIRWNAAAGRNWNKHCKIPRCNWNQCEAIPRKDDTAKRYLYITRGILSGDTVVFPHLEYIRFLNRFTHNSIYMYLTFKYLHYSLIRTYGWFVPI